MKVFIEGCEWKNVYDVDIQAIPKGFDPFDPIPGVPYSLNSKENDYLVTLYYLVNGEKWYHILNCEWVEEIPDENGVLTDDLRIEGVIQGTGDKLKNEEDNIKV